MRRVYLMWLLPFFMQAQVAIAQDYGAFGSESSEQEVPPTWRTDDHNLYQDVATKRKTNRNHWYSPKFAVGAGFNVPELLPFEAYMMFGKYFALRTFYTPVLPFNIRIEMPADVISTKKGIGVANPDFTIRMRAEYGAHYGVEAMVFPFGQSFFLAAGASRRRMHLTGNAKSPILVCSLIEAAKEPPCPDPNARIQTATELEINAVATTTAILGRAAIGGFWHIGRYGYFMMNLGYSKPYKIERSVSVTTDVDSPSSQDPDVTGAIAEVKAEREADLQTKALKEMRPVEEKPLPIFGIAAGIRL